MTLMLPPWGIKTDLQAYWGFNEGIGSIASYDSHSTLTLSDVGGTATTTGKVGRAIDCSGGEYKSIADTATLDMGDIDFAIAFWGQLASKTVTQTAVSKYTSTGNQRGYSVDYNQTADRFRFVMSSDGTSGTITNLDASTFGSPTASVWYFIYVQYDATANLMGISVNNGTLDTTAQTGGAFANTAAFLVGTINAGATQFWSGFVDDLGVWKRKLTSYERTWLYNGGNGRSYYEMPGTATSYDALPGPFAAPFAGH